MITLELYPGKGLGSLNLSAKFSTVFSALRKITAGADSAIELRYLLSVSYPHPDRAGRFREDDPLAADISLRLPDDGLEDRPVHHHPTQELTSVCSCLEGGWRSCMCCRPKACTSLLFVRGMAGWARHMWTVFRAMQETQTTLESCLVTLGATPWT